MRKSKEAKRVEKACEDAFKKHGSNVQFDMFDLGKIMRAGEAAGAAGQDIEVAVIAAIQQYRKN